MKKWIITFLIVIGIILSSLLFVQNKVFALSITPNLLINGDAEVGSTAGWTNSNLFVAVQSQGESMGTVLPYSGNYFFSMAPGPSPYQYAYQYIDISAYSTNIDAGNVEYDASFWFQNEALDWGGGVDTGQLTLSFFDENNSIGEITTGELGHSPSQGNFWSLEGLSGIIPVGTTSVKYEFEGFLHTGSYVNAFFDDASFNLSYEETTPIPEPSTMLLLSSGIIGFLFYTGINRKAKT